jgi:pSer/pThr/pTyr-binding forkhead associated (FHA) protein
MTHQFGRIHVQLPDGGVREFLPAQTVITLGRAATNDIVLTDNKASRTHARLEFAGGAWTLVDLNSTNGVIVNGERVERVQLQEGVQALLGDSLVRVAVETALPTVDTIVIDSEAELDATLAGATLSLNVSDISGPRLGIFTPERTWEVSFAQEYLQIGRSEDNDIDLQMPNVSRHHARIERRGDGFVLRDLESTNGTWLRGQRISECSLQNGDTIRVGDAQLIFKGGGGGDALTMVESTVANPSRLRQPVVFVPGIMGSELWLGGERIWPNVKRIFTEPDILRLPEKHPLEPRDIIREIVVIPNLIELEQYDPLTSYLQEDLGYQKGTDLLEFPYDWRQPLEQTAQRLAKAIDEWKVTPPITLIAHSMGCLVSRYYVERLGGKHKIGRLLLMGGPHQGAPAALTNLLAGPDLLPFGLLGDRLRSVIATFPSAYHLLPIYPCVFDQAGAPLELDVNASWLSDPQRPLLQAARGFRQQLGMQSSVPTVCIFGYNMKTVTRVAVDRDDQGKWQHVKLSTDSSGDGTVPQNSTVLPGADVHPVAQSHGALFVDNDVKMRLKVELTAR